MASKNDLANYRKMSEPFPSVEEATAALEKFYQAVEEARKEFRIMDVHIIVEMNVLRDDQTEGTAMTSAHYGNILEGAPMCAFGLGREHGLGREQADFDAAIREYSKGESTT